MEYYYANPENIDTEKSIIILDGFVYRHLFQVLRKKQGETLILTDGIRNIYYSNIVEIKKDKVICSYSKTDYNLYEPDLYVRLFAAPLRNPDRFEFLIEKAVELGVSEIYPVYTANTVKKGKLSDTYMKRLEKILIGAMGQSQRCFKPLLHRSISFNDMFDLCTDTPNKLFFYEFSDPENKTEVNTENMNVNVFVGPEGGITLNETDIFIENQWKPCSLGKRKLRAETAAITGIFEIINYKKGNL